MRTISNQSRHSAREPRTGISQVELQLHGLRDAPRRRLHQLRREDHGADPRVQPRRACRGLEHRVEAARLALPLRAVEGLAQVQESGCAGGEARGGGGLAQGKVEMTNEKPWRIADLLAGLTF